MNEITALSVVDDQQTSSDEAVGQVLNGLGAGQTFVILSDDDVSRRANRLAAIIAALAPDPVRVVWTGNPLRSPFTVDRLLLQVAGPEIDLRHDYGPPELAAALDVAGPDQARTLIIVQQPETLDPATREALSDAAPHLATQARPVQLLFCGTTQFAPIPATAAIPLTLAAPVAPAMPRRRPLQALTLAILLLAVGLVAWNARPRSDGASSASSSLAPPAEAAVPLPPAALGDPAEAAAATPAHLDVVALRQEFDRFLQAQGGKWSQLTETQKDQLFQEYLKHSQPLTPANQGTRTAG